MASNYCLPPKLAENFLKALRSGEITPAKLTAMTSAARRKFFAEMFGDEHAQEVNALLESKLILKDQQRGLVNWAKQVGGLNEKRRADIIDQITKMDKILAPADQKAFLADLAARKLGVNVTADEAKQIVSLAKTAQDRRAIVQQNPTKENITAYGLSKLDLLESRDALKPNERTWGQTLLDVASAPKTNETGILHFSAFGVQLWGAMATGEAWGGVANMLSYFRDEGNYRNLIGYIVGHPLYPVAAKAGLSITRLGEKLNDREEAFQSSVQERLNEHLKQKGIVPFNAFRASGRAFTGTLNYVRFNGFTRLIEAAKLNGEDVSIGSTAAKEIAAVINNTTGRGSLKTFGLNDSNQAFLNTIFFAPRKVAATVQMFNPMNYIKIGKFGVQSQTARMEAINRMSGSLMATGVVLNLLHMGGVKIDFDPRSADFLKPQIGGVKYDLTGGNAIWVRLLARLVSNQEITSKNKLIELGQGFKPQTRADMVINFVRGKLSPTAAAFADWLYGKDQTGQPFSLTREALKMVMPIPAENMIQFFHSNADHTMAALPAIAGILGEGVESPLPPVGKYKYTIWGQPNDKPWDDKPADPVEQALAHIGWSPGYPSQRLHGVKLSDQQYEEYQQIYGKLVHRLLSGVVQVPGFANRTFGQQERALRAAHETATHQAEGRFIAHHLDLLKAINKAKQDVNRLGTETSRANRAKQ